MPCGKRPLVKLWDKPRKLKVVKPSRYQKNEASVKVHWKKVIKELEDSYKDDQFWETQTDQVRELLGKEIFPRIAKIFDLPLEAHAYQPPPSEESISLKSSDQFYALARPQGSAAVSTTGTGRMSVTNRSALSASSFGGSDIEEGTDSAAGEGTDSEWSVSSEEEPELMKKSRSKTSKASMAMLAKSISKIMSKSKTFSRATMFKSASKAVISKSRTNMSEIIESDDQSLATSEDDLLVHPMSIHPRAKYRRVHNPHFQMLYCNESETDMIKWNSKYKQKKFEISASDEYSKKAELLTKQIALEFYEWWAGLGAVEFKSEIKRPEDIEELFQVWFDEHASRGLKIDPKIIPCVLESIAEFVGEPQAACSKVLKRQIAWDIFSETSPAHTGAFGTCLPIKMKHIPPKNNTKQLWSYVQIPQDLKTFSAVWEDIQHLTSTKAFQTYLEQRPHLPMPPCFIKDELEEKKGLFVVPSDYVVRPGQPKSDFNQELAIPVSQFSLEIKDVLSTMLAD